MARGRRYSSADETPSRRQRARASATHGPVAAINSVNAAPRGIWTRPLALTAAILRVRHPTRIPGAVGTAALIAVVGLLAAGPVVLVAINSFVVSQPGQPDRFGLDAWEIVWRERGLLQAFLNTLTLAIARVAVSMPLSLVIIWLLVRTNARLSGPIEFFYWIAFFLPGLPVTLGWILLLNPQWGLFNQALHTLPFLANMSFDIYSFWGIVFVEIIQATIPAQIILIAPAFRIFDATLEHSSRIAGGSLRRTLFRITLPLLMPTIAVAAVLAMVKAMEGFEVEQLLGVPAGIEVYSTRIYYFMRFEPPQFAVSSALGTLLLLVLIPMVLLQTVFRAPRSEATITGREFSSARINLGRWRWPATVLCLIPAALGSLVPLTLLGIGSFMTLFGYFNIKQPFTLDNWSSVLSHPALAMTLKNSLILGLGSAVVGVLGFTAIAYVIARRRGPATRLLAFLTWLPWFLPGILLGLGLLWAFLGNPILRPLHGTMFGLVLAMAIKEMPLAVQLMQASIGQVSFELEQASAVSGGTWLRTFVRVVLPLVAPAAVSVGIFIFLASVRDVGTVLLLATSDITPISILVLEYSLKGELEKGAVVGLVVSIMVILLALAGRKIGSRLTVR